MQEEYRFPENEQNRPQQNPPQQPNSQQQGWVSPPQWYYDYGPIGQPPQPKEEKPKKPKKPGLGLKILAITMSLLFVLTATSFAAYILLQPPVAGTTDTSEPPKDEPQDEYSHYIPDGDLFTEEETPIGDMTEGVEGEELTKRQIYKKVKPAVVGVICYNKSSLGTQEGGQGSGVIIRQDGYIVTNCHVVCDSDTYEPYDRIEVVLSNGDTYTAQYIGGDRASDLAVLKVTAANLPTATFGESARMQVGDEVMAIGNPSGMTLASSFTHGYVSALSREIYISTIGSNLEYMQTDAAINPGNSGGALVNVYGQVIGITSAKWVAEDFEGIGFAIPIDNAKPIIESLIQTGYAQSTVKIGITYIPVSKTIAEQNDIPRGLRVIDFEEDSDVAKRGLLRGDIITKIDYTDVYDTNTVLQALAGKKPGDTVALTIYRVDEEGHSEILMIHALLSEKTD